MRMLMSMRVGSLLVATVPRWRPGKQRLRQSWGRQVSMTPAMRVPMHTAAVAVADLLSVRALHCKEAYEATGRFAEKRASRVQCALRTPLGSLTRRVRISRPKMSVRITPICPSSAIESECPRSSTVLPSSSRRLIVMPRSTTARP